jgi:hypothetical protein
MNWGSGPRTREIQQRAAAHASCASSAREKCHVGGGWEEGDIGVARRWRRRRGRGAGDALGEAGSGLRKRRGDGCGKKGRVEVGVCGL